MHELFSLAMLDGRRKLEDLELGGETGGLFRMPIAPFCGEVVVAMQGS